MIREIRTEATNEAIILIFRDGQIAIYGEYYGVYSLVVYNVLLWY